MDSGVARTVLVLALAALLGVPAAAAHGQPPALVPLSYHPYPDDADPLGVPYWRVGENAWGYFESYYSIYDEDKNGFDFPSVVLDGVDLIEGAPGGDYEPTLDAYRKGFAERALEESPFTLTVSTVKDAAELRFSIDVAAAEPMDEGGLLLKWALAEDDVYYRPPPALSNGVFVHRFTVRALTPYDEPVLVDLRDGAFAHEGIVALDPAWDVDKLYLAVWVQNEDETSRRFAFAQAPQATMHALDHDHPTVQARHAVLFEMFTATWCAACLFGDSALHTLATEEGFASEAYVESPWVYLREPEIARAVLGAALGLALALVVLAPDPAALVARLRGGGRR